MNEYPLRDRVAVVTGASAGIGEAVARQLVEHGAYCVVNARRTERLRDLVEELGQEDVHAVAGDAGDQGVIDRMLDEARDSLGVAGREADIVVINAGRGLKGSVVDSDIEQWSEMIRTNVEGCARMIRAAGQRMSRETEGKKGASVLDRKRDIVVIGSTVGRHVSPFSSMYGATKFAVHGMVEGARRELGPKGIRVTLIAPGFVTSEFQGVAGYAKDWYEGVQERIGPALDPVDIARLVTFIVSQPAGVHVNDIVIRPTRQDYP